MPVQSSPLFSAPLTIMSRALSLREENAALPRVVGKSSFQVLAFFTVLVVVVVLVGGGAVVSEMVSFFCLLVVGDGSPDSTMFGTCTRCRCPTAEPPWTPSRTDAGEALPRTAEGTTKAPLCVADSNKSRATGTRETIISSLICGN